MFKGYAYHLKINMAFVRIKGQCGEGESTTNQSQERRKCTG